MSSKIVDIPAIVQVIGSVFQSPSILELDDKYYFSDLDFTEEFHRVIFGAIYNLYQLGAKEITLESIDDYLQQRPTKYAIYKTNKGAEWLAQVSASAKFAAFDYYYMRMKKMTLLRAYDNFGLDISWLYDVNNIMDLKKKQAQEDWLDETSLDEVAAIIEGKIEAIRLSCVEDDEQTAVEAGDGIDELIDSFITSPEIGIPLYGALVNTVHRGARLKKFYLRSGATGTGKTRAMVADACHFACNEIYDEGIGIWLPNGGSHSTLFIATEQDKSEVQTMMLAFLSAVNEEHIVTGKYEGDELERVKKAAQVIRNSPLYIEQMPDFSLRDVESKIKKHIRENGVQYVLFDYIQSTMKILGEITKSTGVSKLREDNILFMLSVKLKDLCNKYEIFLLSSTQLSGDWKESKTPDQNLLRGEPNGLSALIYFIPLISGGYAAA